MAELIWNKIILQKLQKGHKNHLNIYNLPGLFSILTSHLRNMKWAPTKILKQLQSYQMTLIKIHFTYIFWDAGQLKLVWAWTHEVLQQ
jgi:hypothetical protein